MKKLLMLMSLFAGLCFTTACDNDDPMPMTPIIVLNNGDITQPQEIAPDMVLEIIAQAEGKIADFTVRIESPFLNSKNLGDLGLSTNMSLVNPASEAMAATLSALGFPIKDQVEGKGMISINLSKFVPMIAQMYNEDSDHKFILTITDTKGQSTTQTLTCHLTKTPGPVISLEGADIDKPQEITADMQLVIKVSAPAGIAAFIVKIESPLLTDALLGQMGLSTTLDLVNPTDAAAAALSSLGFPVKEAVAGQKELTLNLSQFMPMIAQMYPLTSDHKFIITIADIFGQTTSKTVTCHLSK